jgi:hypothetical protein
MLPETAIDIYRLPYTDWGVKKLPLSFFRLLTIFFSFTDVVM